MKIWKWHTLNNKQFTYNIILTIVISVMYIFLTKSIYTNLSIFEVFALVIIHFIFVIVILYEISPMIIKRVIK